MSDNFDKLAFSLSELLPAEIFLLSALTGGGSFAGLRYLTDLHNKIRPIKPPSNKIKLQLPNNHRKDEVPPELSEIAGMSPSDGFMAGLGKSASPTPEEPTWWLPGAAGVMGIPLGFLGTKALYDSYKEKQLNEEIETAKKKYTQQLLAAKQLNKMAGDTPIIDNFCESAAQEIEKIAGRGDTFIKYFSKNPNAQQGGIQLKEKFERVFGEGRKPWVTVPVTAAATAGLVGAGHGIGEASVNLFPDAWNTSKPAVNNLTKRDILNVVPKNDKALEYQTSKKLQSEGTDAAVNLANNASRGALGASSDIWKGIAILMASGTFGMLLHNHLKKKEKELKSSYPIGVEYAN
jgi:hypothetical protein